MLKNDLETRRISRMGSLITPPRCADGAIAITRVSLVPGAGASIKQKVVAQGNTSRTPTNGPALLLSFADGTDLARDAFSSPHHRVSRSAPRPVQAAPLRQPLGIGLRKRAVGLEGLDALWRGADGVDRLTGDGEAAKPRRTERRARLAVGKAMHRHVQDIGQHRKPKPRP